MPQLTSIAIEEARDFFMAIEFEDTKALIAEEALKEIRGRLQLMCDMGLGYLTLDRGAHTLSGGEAQRIRLASQIGSGLVGVLYILDEPSIGLHHRDNERLLTTLKRLRDIGNTVFVVEHDEETMREADLMVLSRMRKAGPGYARTARAKVPHWAHGAPVAHHHDSALLQDRSAGGQVPCRERGAPPIRYKDVFLGWGEGPWTP